MRRMRLGCILADEMGLGKTIQAIALLVALREAGEMGPHLIVAPASTLENWMNELHRWSPSLRAHKYHGPQSARRKMQVGSGVLTGAPLVIRSWHVAWRNRL